MSINIEKQIAHWRKGAEEDFAVAEETVASGRLRHGLFWAHLAMEKMLKAHVAKTTQAMAPKIHNLDRLAELSGITLPVETKRFLGRLNAYQLEGRYAEFLSDTNLTKQHTDSLLTSARETLEWLKVRL